MTEPTEVGARGAEDEGQVGPVIRDRRRIDPQTGQVREPLQTNADDATVATEAAAEGVAVAELVAEQARSEELLGDLQRLNAEYVNYRKRVDRDRDVARESAISTVLEAMLPVLDDIHLARQHGDLETGPFAAIADKLEAVMSKFGLERFGEVGEEFDPARYEALMRTEAELAPGTETTTVVQILQPGYRIGNRVLRPARVAVADPS